MPLQTSVQILLGPIVTRSSRNASILFDIVPPDVIGRNSGNTSASRIYRNGTTVNLVAPLQYEGRKFDYWQIEKSNGSKELFTENDIFIDITQNTIAKCIYRASLMYSYPEFIIGQIGYNGQISTTLDTGVEFLIGQIGYSTQRETLSTGVEIEIL